MPIHLQAQIACGTILLVTGLSHVAAPAAWGRLFGDLARLPSGGLIVGIAAFLMGIVFVSLHNRWVIEPGLVVTIIAWAWVIKGVLYLVRPQILGRVSRRAVRSPERFAWVGWGMLAMGALLIADGLWRVSAA